MERVLRVQVRACVGLRFSGSFDSQSRRGSGVQGPPCHRCGHGITWDRGFGISVTTPFPCARRTQWACFHGAAANLCREKFTGVVARRPVRQLLVIKLKAPAKFIQFKNSGGIGRVLVRRVCQKSPLRKKSYQKYSFTYDCLQLITVFFCRSSLQHLLQQSTRLRIRSSRSFYVLSIV